MFKPTKAKTPEEYIKMIDEPRRTEIQKLYDFIKQTLPGEKPFILYGMIGFVPYHYKSSSGRERIGVSSRSPVRKTISQSMSVLLTGSNMLQKNTKKIYQKQVSAKAAYALKKQLILI